MRLQEERDLEWFARWLSIARLLCGWRTKASLLSHDGWSLALESVPACVEHYFQRKQDLLSLGTLMAFSLAAFVVGFYLLLYSGRLWLLRTVGYGNMLSFTDAAFWIWPWLTAIGIALVGIGSARRLPSALSAARHILIWLLAATTPIVAFYVLLRFTSFTWSGSEMPSKRMHGAFNLFVAPALGATLIVIAKLRWKPRTSPAPRGSRPAAK